MNKLSLCCGELHRGDPSWTRLDCNPACAPDIICTIPPLPTYAPWDVIELIHGIEHFAPWEAKELLSQCYKALHVGGVLILEQPNLLTCCKVLLGQLAKPEEQFSGQFDIAGIFGDPSHKSLLMMHRWAWYPKSLTDELIEAGFHRSFIIERPAQYHSSFRDFRLEAKG